MRVRFLTEPQLRPTGDGEQWELLDDFVVLIEDDSTAPAPGLRTIVVPGGFATDLASVPRLPGAYLLFAGRARRSAILHDWLYEQRYSRAWADAVFRAAMAAEDVGPASRWAMWAGVRLGGASIYADRAPADDTPEHYRPQ